MKVKVVIQAVLMMSMALLSVSCTTSTVVHTTKSDVQLQGNYSFVAIDVETANSDRSTICQIGLVRYEHGKKVDEWETYVNPEATFSAFNIGVHGIHPEDVADSPKFNEVIPMLQKYLEGATVVSHGSFDKTAITKAFGKFGVTPPNSTWLNSLLVARRTWSKEEVPSYGLGDLCKHLNHTFNHHDAFADAKAAAIVFLAASEREKLDVDGWLVRVTQPIYIRKT